MHIVKKYHSESYAAYQRNCEQVEQELARMSPAELKQHEQEIANSLYYRMCLSACVSKPQDIGKGPRMVRSAW